MAMTKPIVVDVNAFDSTNSHIFYFTSVGGNQVVKNEIRIKNNSTDQIVYQNTVESYEFKQEVPSDTLTNGNQYSVSFRTYGISNQDISDWSMELPFYCYSTPTISLNIQNGQVIENATFVVRLNYNQSEEELLDYATIELYDAFTNVLINKSPNLYNDETPPLYLDYMLEGLVDGKNYKIKAIVSTVEQTIVETSFINFSVSYKKPELYSNLYAEPKNCDGYVKISSSYIDILGKTHPTNEIYIDDEKIDCRGADHNITHTDTSYNVLFEDGFSVQKNTLIRLWFNPACIEGNVLYLYSSESEEFVNVEYVRGNDYDYFNITTHSGTNITTDPFAHCNGTETFFLWLKIVGNEWEVLIEKTNKTQSIFNWEDYTNNISWNVTIDDTWLDEPTFEQFTPSQNVKFALDSNLNNVIVGNGVFDHINITNNIDTAYTTDKPSWDFDTVLDCDFNGNVNGGNIAILLNQIKAVRLKRRDSSTSNWITIFEQNVNSIDDININFADTLIPSNIEQTYAFVPILANGIEGDYVTSVVTPKWNGTFISDDEYTFKLYNSVVYDNSNQNIQIGSLSPLGAKYPTIIQNSEINYKSGAISCQLCGYKFEETRKIDRNDVTNQTNDFLRFLSNGKPKCLVDWNGNDIIFRVIASPSVSYNSYYGNGIVNVAFSWAEQGVYNNQEDLKELGFSKILLN